MEKLIVNGGNVGKIPLSLKKVEFLFLKRKEYSPDNNYVKALKAALYEKGTQS